jgi:hypothetical protein
MIWIIYGGNSLLPEEKTAKVEIHAFLLHDSSAKSAKLGLELTLVNIAAGIFQ